MSWKTALLLALNAIILLTAVAIQVKRKKPVIHNAPQKRLVREEPRTVLPEIPAVQFKIGMARPPYLNYQGIVQQLQTWQREAPEIVETASYGTTSRNKEIHYIRVTNRQKGPKPVVLITACIHGNEPLATSVTMWQIGALLEGYGKDNRITELVDTRDIYFVPVVSPDSYPHSRHVDGVDPNRDFPSPGQPNRRSRAPVAAIQKLFNQIKPSAVISGHTWGRVYLVPWGDQMANSPNHEDYRRIIGQMSDLSGYRWIRACDMYQSNGGLNNPPIRTMGSHLEGCGCSYGGSVPIHGTEVDWYYRNGAFSIVCEFGTHQRIPSDADTRTEFAQTFNAFLYFVEQGPLVKVRPS